MPVCHSIQKYYENRKHTAHTLSKRHEHQPGFFKDILGFKEVEWGTDDFTDVNRDNAGIYLCKGAQGNAGTWLWIGFDGDIFKLHDELKTKDVKIKMPPTNFS